LSETLPQDAKYTADAVRERGRGSQGVAKGQQTRSTAYRGGFSAVGCLPAYREPRGLPR